jgi:cell fate (sporulation/competence/biofilm development) regulator YmcA (YheA/YmcA/DUF963 family)
VFQTKIGKAMVDEQLLGKGVNYANVPAQNIPGKAFKSPDEYYALVDTLGGNEKLAQLQGQRYFAGELEAIKNSKQAEDFIRKNRTMLKEVDAYNMAQDYAIALRNAEKRGAKATERGAARLDVAAKQRQLQNEFARIESDLNRARTIDEIDTQVTKVANTLEKNQIITIEQRDQLLRDMQTIVDAKQKSDRIKQWMKYGLAAIAGSSIGEAYRIYSR